MHDWNIPEDGNIIESDLEICFLSNVVFIDTVMFKNINPVADNL